MIIKKETFFYRVLQFTFTGIDPYLILIITLLSLIGLTTLYSAASGFYEYQFYDQLRNFSLMALIAFVISRLPFFVLFRAALPIYLVGVFLLICVKLFGVEMLGAKRWLHIGFARIQPSEIMKIALPLMLAWYFHFRNQHLKLLDYAVSGILLLIPFILIVTQPDLGTAILIFCSGFFVIYFAGFSLKILLFLSTIFVVLVSTLIINKSALCDPDTDWVVLREYQKQRVCTLLNPETDPRGSSYHIRQSTIAVGSGGLYGKGHLKGTQTHLKFIPEKTTDFIFAVYSEEFGLIGNITLIILFILLVLRGLIISLQSPLVFTRLLGCALSMTIFIYMIVNMGMVTGIFPVVGIPLPFISYGGTSLLTMGMIIGLLLAICRYTKLHDSGIPIKYT